MSYIAVISKKRLHVFHPHKFLLMSNDLSLGHSSHTPVCDIRKTACFLSCKIVVHTCYVFRFNANVD